MKLGILKNILLENNIERILVRSELYQEPLHVVDALFDQQSRCKVFLTINTSTKPRTNKIQTIKSYLLDFKDTHDIFLLNEDRKNAIYNIDLTYEIDKSNGVLILNSIR